MKYWIAICVVLAVLSYDSVLFLVYLGTSYLWLKLAVFLALVSAVVFFQGRQNKPTRIPTFIFCYGLLAVYMLVPTAAAGAQSAYYWTTSAVRLSYILLLFILFNRIGSHFLNGTFKWIGLLLAVQSIVLYGLLVSGRAPTPVLVERYAPIRFGGSDLFTSYGIFGFGNWLLESESGSIAFRVQSIFSEATRFAMFQMYPLFACLISPRLTGLNKTFATIIGMSIFLTFSFSAYVGLLFGALSYWIIPRLPRFNRLTKATLVLIIAGLMTFVYYSFSRMLFENVGRDATRPEVNSIGRSEDAANVRIEWSMAAFAQLTETPLGTGFSIEESALGGMGALPVAPVQWFLTGGIMGGLIMLGIQALLIGKHFLPNLTSREKPQRVMAACCISIMVTSVVHGNWTELVYFVPIAVLVTGEANSHARRPPPSPHGTSRLVGAPPAAIRCDLQQAARGI